MSIPELLHIEAVCACVVLSLCIWPLARTFSALARELRDRGNGAIVALLLVWAVSASLRLVLANQAFLYNLPDMHTYFERLFSPLGPASTWHHHHGMGGFVVHAGLAQIFGKSYKLVWAFNGFVGSLTPLLLYLVTLKLFSDRRAAFIAAALLAVFPPAIRVDASEQMHSLSICLVLVAYFSILTAVEKPTLKSYLAAGIAGAAALQMRAEALPHVFFACVLAVLKIRGMARPRWGLPLLLGIAVLVIPAIPRAVLTLLAIAKEDISTWGAGLGVLGDLFFSKLHLYANPMLSLPIYPLLTLTGIAVLAITRNWRLLVFFLAVMALQHYMYFNEWVLDTNEAFRFQAHMWFIQIALAGVGLAWLSRLPGRASIQGVIVAAGITVAAFSLVPARGILTQPQEADQDVLFFARRLPELPRACRLALLRVDRSASDRYFGPKTWPEWLLKEHGRSDTLAYPAELERVSPAHACYAAYIGIDCYRRYPEDSMSEEQIEKMFYQPGRPFCQDIVEAWQSDLDRNPPPLLRPECQALMDKFRLKEFAVMQVTPGRPTWIWSPGTPLTIGFYLLD